MKVTPIDFILGFVTATVVILASWFLTFQVASPFLRNVLQEYLPVFNVILFATLFGLVAALVLRILLLVRPLKVGEFDFNSSEFTYWKLLTMLHYFGYRALFLFQFEPMVPLLAKLFGAKIGANVAIGGFLDSPYLITVANNCVLGRGSLITANLVVNDKLILGPVLIESNTTVGVYSLVMPNTVLGAKSSLAPSSVLMLGSKVPEGEAWKGHPARKWL